MLLHHEFPEAIDALLALDVQLLKFDIDKAAIFPQSFGFHKRRVQMDVRQSLHASICTSCCQIYHERAVIECRLWVAEGEIADDGVADAFVAACYGGDAGVGHYAAYVI